jgi:hypothetical protein
MMRFMHQFKQGLPVHSAVGPVKVCIVHQDHQRYAEKVISITLVADIWIDFGEAFFTGVDYQHDHCTKYQHGEK